MSLLELDRSLTGWWVLGVALLVGLAFVLHSFVGTFVFGIFIYYATRPLYRRIRRQVRPSSVAAGVALFLLALPALLLAGYAVLVVLREVEPLLDRTQFDPSAYPVLDELGGRIADPESLASADLSTFLSADRVGTMLDSLSSAGDVLAFLGIGAVHAFLMVALAFFLLRDDHRLSQWVRRTFGDDRGVLQEFIRAVDHDLDSIFFGNILNAVVTGTIGVMAYSVLNVAAPPGHRIPAAALVGLLAGVASLIPVVGMKLVYVPVTLFMTGRVVVTGATDALWFVVAFAAVSFVVVDTIPDLVLRPYVSGRSLHVGSVMIAYTLGPLLFGWYGIFLMPMLLVVVFHFARVVLPVILRRDTESPPPAGVDPVYTEDVPTADVGPGPPESATTDGAGTETNTGTGTGTGTSADASGPRPGPDAGPDAE
jgi:predicted PurR-regulated permease PerM